MSAVEGSSSSEGGCEHELIERLLDAQQDINLAANETMSQPLADASALIDEIEPILRRALSEQPRPCRYCGPSVRTGLPGNACENCMGTGLDEPAALQPSSAADAKPVAWTIEERFPALNDHLIRMASTGQTGSLTEWGEFFDALRTALIAQPHPSQQAGAWLPIADYHGCGPVLVGRPTDSKLFYHTLSAFMDVTGVWRVLSSEGGMAPVPYEPTHFQPLPAAPLAALKPVSA